MMKKGASIVAAITLVIAMCLIGCVRLALRTSPSLLTEMSEAIFEECDPKLAEVSLPAQLKFLEGLLRQDPTNRRLLTTLSMGFAGYALLFVEEEEPERASQLFFRAREYGLHALGLQQQDLKTRQELPENLGTRDAMDFEALFWTTVSWSAWIALNLDQPTALAQVSIAEELLERALAIHSTFFEGTLYILKGTMLTARASLGGDELQKARDCFEQALAVSQRRYFMAHVYYASRYAVRVQDKALLVRLTEEVIAKHPGFPGKTCLINAVMLERAKRLAASMDELFY